MINETAESLFGVSLHNLESATDEEIFATFEQAEAEGAFAEELVTPWHLELAEQADSRHLIRMSQEPPPHERQYRAILVDYDDTLSRSLTELSEEMLENITSFLRAGVHVGIQTLQPIGERGVTEYTIRPLLSCLDRKGVSQSVLRHLHLMPSEGVHGYRFDGRNLKREYDHGFPKEAWSEFKAIVVDGSEGQSAECAFDRDTYISLHYPSASQRDSAVRSLAERLEAFIPAVRFTKKDLPELGKFVVHIKLKRASKALGRGYFLRSVRENSDASVSRGSILVAGDDMGPGGTDAAMLVRGGVNLNLGDCENRLAYSEWMGKRSEGLLQFFRLLCPR